jgi:pimeloyl-ACP methyl ester carboxylesterase
MMMAAWLSELGCVIALDLRGHGSSESRPADVSLDAYVGDSVAAAAELGTAPIVVGQSLGGSIAIAMAACHPKAVRGLVVVEASPTADPDAAEVVRRWLDSWPTPFPSRGDAETFFGGGLAGAAWAAGLAAADDGLRPRFEPDVVEDALHQIAAVDLWAEWRRIECPTLVVRGSRGDLDPAEASQMASENSNARYAEVEEAGHDVHLDNPTGFRSVLEPFVTETAAAAR